MNATTLRSTRRAGFFVADWATFPRALLATAGSYFRRAMSYTINVIRIPLWPLSMFAVAWLAWEASGREAVAGTDVAGFLLAGMVGQIAWISSVWGGGASIDEERFEGTIAALFLSPASRVAMILGCGLGNLLFLLPSLAVVVVFGLLIGARTNIADPLAAGLGLLAIIVASVAMGLLLAALFVLTRRANLAANVIQHPVNLLAGFIIPRDELPGVLRALSDALPVAHAVDAFRAATVAGASRGEVSGALVLSFALSGGCLLLGAVGLRKVERLARRNGQLDLF